MEQDKRNWSLDFIRAVAAFLVVLNHAVVLCYPIDSGNIVHLSAKDQLFSLTAFTLGRIGVPLFLLLTGYLLLPRMYNEARITRFYRHNLLPMFLVWELWTLLYQFYIAWYEGTSFGFASYIRRALLLELVGLPHAWYMPMILGIYLFLPFVAVALSHMRGSILALLVAIIYLASFVVPNVLLTVEIYQLTLPYMSVRLDVGFGGGTYGLYLILGYCLARYQESIGHMLTKVGVVLVSTAVIIGGERQLAIS